MDKIVSHFSSYSGSYKNGLTNHLPMVLFALSGMGGSEISLMEYGNWYIESRKVEKLIPSTIEIDGSNWEEHLGKHKYEFEYRSFFNEEVEKFGLEQVLKLYLPRLMEGLPAAAFHGIIRLSYGLENKNSDEIVSSLAYFATTYLPVTLDLNLPLDGISSRFKQLSKSSYFKAKNFTGNSIFGRIEEVNHDNETLSLLKGVKVDDSTLSEIRKAVIELYHKTGNFTVLHLVTSTHAMRIILDYVENREELINLFWISLQIGYLTTNCTPLKETDITDSTLSWNQVIKLALTKKNDHTIKLVYTCYSEYQQDKNPLYLDVSVKEIEGSV